MGQGAWRVDVAISEDLAVLFREDAGVGETLEVLGTVGVFVAAEGYAFFVNALLVICTRGPLITIRSIHTRLGQRTTFPLSTLKTHLAISLPTTCLSNTFIFPAEIALGTWSPLIAVRIVLEDASLGKRC